MDKGSNYFLKGHHYFPGEKEAIKAAIEAGKRFGFGNLIAHLRTAWGMSLMEQYFFSVALAYTATEASGEPFREILEKHRNYLMNRETSSEYIIPEREV